MITAERRRELVDELVSERSRLVLGYDEGDGPEPAAASSWWPLWLTTMATRAAAGSQDQRRQVVRGAALIALAWLEACERDEDD